MIESACKFHSSAASGLLRSRRSFLASSAAVIGAVMMPSRWAVAEQARLIDTHHHFYPPEYQKLWLDWEEKRRIPHFQAQVAWSRATAIEEMDKNGIRTAIQSLASTPGVWFDLAGPQAAHIARVC